MAASWHTFWPQHRVRGVKNAVGSYCGYKLHTGFGSIDARKIYKAFIAYENSSQHYCAISNLQRDVAPLSHLRHFRVPVPEEYQRNFGNLIQHPPLAE